MKPRRTTPSLILCLALVACSPSGPDFSTPESTVREQMRAIAESRPEILWDSLPTSYREDITDLLHDAAQRVHPETWDRWADLLRQLASVATDQREFILGSGMMAMTPVGDELQENWDQLAGALRTVAESDLLDREKAETLDIRDYLEGQGAQTMQLLSSIEGSEGQGPRSLVQKLDELEVVVIEREQDLARLEMRLPGERPETRTLVWVEDRWVDETIAKDWPEDLAEARAMVEEMTPETTRLTAEQQQFISLVETVLGQLAAAQTQEDFDSALQGAVGAIMGMMMFSGVTA